MSDALTYGEYSKEVEEIASRLADEAAERAEGTDDDPRQVVFEWVSEELDYHNWFARDYYDGALYGSIVDHCEADVARYSDWQALIEASEPMDALKKMAYCAMEADVIRVAHRMLEDEG